MTQAMQLSMFDAPIAQIEPPPEPNGDAKLAARLRQMADKLDAQIENKLSPMTQNATPKRMRQYAQRRHEGADLERTQKALYALADLHEQGHVPPELVGVKTKKAIAPLVHTRGASAGYYDYSDTGEFYDTTPTAILLQELISGTPEQRAEKKRLAEISHLEGKARMSVGSIPGFFPTTKEIARQMVQLADIQSCMSVLEPSAGSGAIVDIVREMCPKANIAVCERNYSLRKLLELKGYHLIDQDDFLEYFVTQNGVDGWHRIVMNPPFEKQQDIDHVRHAYDCLKCGGRLVSVMSESAFFQNNKKAQAFREWLDDKLTDEIDLPAGAFSESGTGVKTRIIVLDK